MCLHFGLHAACTKARFMGLSDSLKERFSEYCYLTLVYKKCLRDNCKMTSIGTFEILYIPVLDILYLYLILFVSHTFYIKMFFCTRFSINLKLCNVVYAVISHRSISVSTDFFSPSSLSSSSETF